MAREYYGLGESLPPCAFMGDVQRLELFVGDTRLQLIDAIDTSGGWWFRHNSVATKCADKTVPATIRQTGSAAADFHPCEGVPSMRTSALYAPPVDSHGLMIIEIMTDSYSCPPGDVSAGCFDFIKVKNTGDSPVDLTDFRLRTGSATASSSDTNTFLWEQPTAYPDGTRLMLEAGKTLTIKARNSGTPLTLTNGDGMVWIEDYFGVRVYQTVTYSDMELAAASGKSWMYDEATEQWVFGEPSPFRPNTPYSEPLDGGEGSGSPQLVPCRDDQYRSEETNRCRNIVAASTLVPCREGQYRSEETNRCRSIVSAVAGTLKPCADDQFRNPDTNRCKKIASDEDIALADCGEGRERNPETNRCRNIVAVAPPEAEFAVEPVADPQSVFIGWWIAGGAALIALGYGGWEWREEIGRLVRKVYRAITSGKRS
jgi:hypothetical protein